MGCLQWSSAAQLQWPLRAGDVLPVAPHQTWPRHHWVRGHHSPHLGPQGMEAGQRPSVISHNIRISPDSFPLRGRKRRSPKPPKTSEAKSLGLLAGRSCPLMSCWLSIDLSGTSPSQQRSLPSLRTGGRVWTRLSEEDTFWRRGETRRANLLRTRTYTSQYPVRLKPGEKLKQQRIV